MATVNSNTLGKATVVLLFNQNGKDDMGRQQIRLLPFCRVEIGLDGDKASYIMPFQLFSPFGDAGSEPFRMVLESASMQEGIPSRAAVQMFGSV